MLTQEQAVEIRVMARRGEGIRAIARQAGCSRNTVRRYLRDEAAKRYKARAPRPCKLDDHKVYLAERVRQASPRWIPATVLLREIRERGYIGGVSALKAWLAPLKSGVSTVCDSDRRRPPCLNHVPTAGNAVVLCVLAGRFVQELVISTA
jgi:transposase